MMRQSGLKLRGKSLAETDQALFSERVATAGSTVTVRGVGDVKAFVVTDMRAVLKFLRIEGDPPAKLPTIFLLDYSLFGVVGKGAHITSQNGTFAVDALHANFVADICVYHAVSCYEV